MNQVMEVLMKRKSVRFDEYSSFLKITFAD